MAKNGKFKNLKLKNEKICLKSVFGDGDHV